MIYIIYEYAEIQYFSVYISFIINRHLHNLMIGFINQETFSIIFYQDIIQMPTRQSHITKITHEYLIAEIIIALSQ